MGWYVGGLFGCECGRFFFFQAEDGIREAQESRGLGDVYKRQVLGRAAITGAVALAILVLVRDPPRLSTARNGSLLDLLRIPALWPILAMMVVCYMPIAGLRGLWVGPYFADVHGADQAEIARVSLWIGLAMVAGNFAYLSLIHISEPTRPLSISYAVFCLKKKTYTAYYTDPTHST